MTAPCQCPPRVAVPAEIWAHALVGHDPLAPVISLAGMTMGTSWCVRLAAASGHDAGSISDAICLRLDGLVAEMSHWDAGSLLGRFNRAPAGTWIDLPRDFRKVMVDAIDVAEASGGSFDPAIGALVNLWGFGPTPVANPPAPTAIAAAMHLSGWHRLTYDEDAGRLCQPGGVQLDLSGIAKGYAADAIAGLLRGLGIRHCLVEIGGELVGRGLRPDGDPWWVDVETPAGVAPFRVALHELAVATSGNYVRGDHMIDPKTGRPASNGVTAVSVIHESAMCADAWASALMVLGEHAGMIMAARHRIAARFLMCDKGVNRETLSPALQALLIG